MNPQNNIHSIFGFENIYKTRLFNNVKNELSLLKNFDRSESEIWELVIKMSEV